MEQQAAEQESVKTNVRSMTTREDGSLSLTTVEEQIAFAKRLMAEGMISETFKTPQQVLIGMQYANALKIPVILGLRMMYVVNGRPCLYGEGPLSLVQKHPSFVKISEYFINEAGEKICVENKNLKDTPWAAVTSVWRANDEEPQTDWFSVEDMARSGVDKNKFGKKVVWEKYEKNMLRFRARSLALKTKFADVIAGVPIAEHDEQFSPDTPQVRVAKTAAEEMNSEYGPAALDATEKID